MQAASLLGILSFSLALALCQYCSAKTIGGHIPLTVSSSDLTYSVNFSTGESATAQPKASGILYARIEWDDQTLEPKSLQIYQGGALSIESFHLNIASKITPPNSGPIDTFWIFGFYALSVTIDNGDASGPLIRSDGRLNPNHLDLKTTSGEISLTLEANGQIDTEKKSYYGTPEEFVLTNAPLLRIKKTYADRLRENYDISIEFSFDSEEREAFPDLNLHIDSMERGEVIFSGQTEFTTKFGSWAPSAAKHFPTLDRGFVSKNGLPIELAYALALELRIPYHRNPLIWTIENGRPTLSIVSRELNEDIAIERSSNLSSGDWSPIPSSWLLNGEASLKSGSYQLIKANVPEGEPNVFLRVRPSLTSFQ